MFSSVLSALETEAFLLRAPCLSDVDALFTEVFSDPCTMRFLSFEQHRSVDETRALVTGIIEAHQHGQRLAFFLICKRTNSIFAIFWLEIFPPQIEVGLITNRNSQCKNRRGSLRFFRMFIAKLLSLPGIFRICAFCATDGPSWHAMERIGFTCEGRLKYYELRPNHAVPYADCFLYAMTRRPPRPTVLDDCPIRDALFLI
jgi:RimJ/RimL family protein N-acetyltransferase